MEIFNADRQRNLEINNLLQKIKYEADKQQAGTFVYFPIFVINGRDIEYKISPSGQILFKELKKMGAIELKERSCEEINKTLEEARKSKNKPLIAEGYLVRPIEPKFSQLCKKYEKRISEKLEEKIENFPSTPNKYRISIKDREIWVNDYLIGKPHAVGSNLEFFEYIRSQPVNTKIERKNLPDFGGLSLKEQIKNKGFIKILNGLGFKGEILKAFFYKRGKDTLIYEGDEITKEDLKKAGVKISLFLMELKLAHMKNSPE